MMLGKQDGHLLAILAAVAMLSLTGADCAISINTGSSSSDKEEDEPTVVLGIVDGQLVDAPVEGVQYESGALRGITGPAGEFRYEHGGLVRFHIGDIPLGGAVPGKALMTPQDLLGSASLDSTPVINLGRLLQSLDAVAGDERITIPAQVRERALTSNPGLAGVIEYLDYADETRFVNAASQLLAVLSEGYPHTVMLVDAATALAHMRESLARAGLSPDE
mgnify:CR=1 FL=1|jgi:hypothetical protein